MGAEDLEHLAAAGLTDEGVVQAVTISAMFNLHTGVADATGVEPEYASPLSRLEVNAARAPLPRPDPTAWPAPLRSPRFALSLRPRTAGLIADLHAYVYTPSAALSVRDRAVAGRAATHVLYDAAGMEGWGGAEPADERKAAIAA